MPDEQQRDHYVYVCVREPEGRRGTMRDATTSSATSGKIRDAGIKTDTGHTYFALQAPGQNRPEAYHYGPKGRLGVKGAMFGADSQVTVEPIDAKKQARQEKVVRIAVTKEQHDQLKAYAHSEIASGQKLKATQGRGSGGKRTYDGRANYHLGSVTNRSNQCTTFTFRAMEHAKVDEAKKYKAHSPRGVGRNMDRHRRAGQDAPQPPTNRRGEPIKRPTPAPAQSSKAQSSQPRPSQPPARNPQNRPPPKQKPPRM